MVHQSSPRTVATPAPTSRPRATACRSHNQCPARVGTNAASATAATSPPPCPIAASHGPSPCEAWGGAEGGTALPPRCTPTLPPPHPSREGGEKRRAARHYRNAAPHPCHHPNPPPLRRGGRTAPRPCPSPCEAGGGWEGGVACWQRAARACPHPDPPPLRRGGRT